MRVLKQKARQYGEDRSLRMAEMSVFLEELEWRVDVAFNMIDIYQRMEGVSEKGRKIKIAHEVRWVIDYARGIRLKGKRAMPLQLRRVVDKYRRLLALAEDILIEEGS